MLPELSFQEYSDRLPPQNIDAEEAILGGILLDPEALGRVLELLRPEAFYISAHQDIYKACMALNTQGRPTDLMSVSTYLADNKLLEKVGGMSRLAQLVDRTVSAVNIDQYAQLIADKYLRRRLINVGTEIAQSAYETAAPLEKILDAAEQKVFNVTQARPNQGLATTADVLTTTFSDIESRSLGLVLPGISCGFYDLDAMTQGFQRSDLIIAAGRPSMGKCLVHSAEIVLADGSIATIEEIYQQRQATLLTLGQDWKFQLTRPSAYVDDGVKPVFRVQTRLGRSLETTLTHPYLTLQGWRPLAHLKPGDRIAVPRKVEVFGSETLRSCEVKLLAYLLGDGCLTRTNPGFTNTNPQIQAELTEAIENRNQLTAWLKTLGLWHQSSHTKFIPSIVFQLERSQLALFLNRLFATDGWATVLASGQAQLGYASVSEKLARQVQHLLLRFGIIASLKLRSVKYGDTRRPAWQLDITDARSIKTFLDEIGVFGKEAALEQVKAVLTHRRYQTNRDLIPVEVWQQIVAAKGEETWQSLAKRAGIQGDLNLQVGKRALTRDRLFILATALEDEALQHLATSDIYWDEIVAIEFVGDRQVYDLTIPETHNFVANDICVHNTSFVLNIARNIAAFHKLPIAVFSLEMSKEQLVYRLLSSESQVESGRLRSGRISQQEWEPLGHAISVLSQLGIHIDDTADISVSEMRSKVRRLQAEEGNLGLILIDYLQLMEGSGDNRVQELSKITRSLKSLAREVNAPVIALSQLSRGVESRTNKRPMMSDLRESGSIEQDADLVMMLYREEYYNPDTPDRGIAEVIITKHRNGPVGTVKLLFEPQFTRFRNLAAPPERRTY